MRIVIWQAHAPIRKLKPIAVHEYCFIKAAKNPNPMKTIMWTDKNRP